MSEVYTPFARRTVARSIGELANSYALKIRALSSAVKRRCFSRTPDSGSEDIGIPYLPLYDFPGSVGFTHHRHIGTCQQSEPPGFVNTFGIRDDYRLYRDRLWLGQRDGTWTYDHSMESCQIVDTGNGPPPPPDTTPIDCSGYPTLCAVARKRADFDLAQEHNCINSGGKFISISNGSAADAGSALGAYAMQPQVITANPGACGYFVTLHLDGGYDFEPIGGSGLLPRIDLNSSGARLSSDCIVRFSTSGYF